MIASLIAICLVLLTGGMPILGGNEARAQDGRRLVIAADARIAGDSARTRFVVDLSRTVEFVLFPLADPYRLVIDLPGVQFTLDPAKGERGRGLIRGYRWGARSEGNSRMVLDLEGPVKVESTFMIPALDQQPARLVIDITETDRNTFLNEQVSEMFGTSVSQQPSGGAPAGATEYAIPIQGPTKSVLPVIVIDPGHGGVDSGAVGAQKSLEKDVVLEFALLLAAELRGGGRVNPILTRSGDEFLNLAQRVNIARENHAVLFLSIHADSVGEREVNGATVYTLSDKASDRVAAAAARRENRSDVIGGYASAQTSSQVEDILLSLMSRETKYLSQNFARVLVSTLTKTIKLIKNPNRSAAFKVLEAPDVPSVLIELGYLSNRADEARLNSADWRDRATAAIAVAIEEFIRSQ